MGSPQGPLPCFPGPLFAKPDRQRRNRLGKQPCWRWRSAVLLLILHLVVYSYGQTNAQQLSQQLTDAVTSAVLRTGLSNVSLPLISSVPIPALGPASVPRRVLGTSQALTIYGAGPPGTTAILDMQQNDEFLEALGTVNTTLGPSLTLANMCASRVHLTPNGFWLATPFALRLPLDPTLVLTGAPNVTPLNTTFTLTNVTAVGSRSDVMALIYLYTIWRTSFAPPVLSTARLLAPALIPACGASITPTSITFSAAVLPAGARVTSNSTFQAPINLDPSLANLTSAWTLCDDDDEVPFDGVYNGTFAPQWVTYDSNSLLTALQAASKWQAPDGFDPLDLPLSIILTHNAVLPQSFSLRFSLNSSLILSGPVDDNSVAISPSVTLDLAQLPGPFRMGPGTSVVISGLVLAGLRTSDLGGLLSPPDTPDTSNSSGNSTSNITATSILSNSSAAAGFPPPASPASTPGTVQDGVDASLPLWAFRFTSRNSPQIFLRNVTLLVGTTEFYVLTLQAARLTACSPGSTSPDIILGDGNMTTGSLTEELYGADLPDDLPGGSPNSGGSLSGTNSTNGSSNTGLPSSAYDLSSFSFRMTQINLASQQLVLDTFFGLGLNASRLVIAPSVPISGSLVSTIRLTRRAMCRSLDQSDSSGSRTAPGSSMFNDSSSKGSSPGGSSPDVPLAIGLGLGLGISFIVVLVAAAWIGYILYQKRSQMESLRQQSSEQGLPLHSGTPGSPKYNGAMVTAMEEGSASLGSHIRGAAVDSVTASGCGTHSSLTSSRAGESLKGAHEEISVHEGSAVLLNTGHSATGSGLSGMPAASTVAQLTTLTTATTISALSGTQPGSSISHGLGAAAQNYAVVSLAVGQPLPCADAAAPPAAGQQGMGYFQDPVASVLSQASEGRPTAGSAGTGGSIPRTPSSTAGALMQAVVQASIHKGLNSVQGSQVLLPPNSAAATGDRAQEEESPEQQGHPAGASGRAASSSGAGSCQKVAVPGSLPKGGPSSGGSAPVPDPMDRVRQVANQLQGSAISKVVLQEALGTGTWGTVWKGIWRNLPVAVKVLVCADHPPAAPAAPGAPPGGTSPTAGAPGLGGGAPVVGAHRGVMPLERAIMEAGVCVSVVHPNIVATYAHDIQEIKEDASSASRNGSAFQVTFASSGLADAAQAASVRLYKMYLIQELCATTLDETLGQGVLHNPVTRELDWAAALTVLIDCAAGLSCLHSKSILHGDLKPANILLKLEAPSAAAGRGDMSPRVVAKLTDFGLSTTIMPEKGVVSNYHAGTPFYCAPEVALEGRGSMASDIWSFGVIMWEVYHGQRPYLKSVNGAVHLNPSFPMFPPNTPRAFITATHLCLQRDPTARPSSRQLHALLTELYNEWVARPAHAALMASIPVVAANANGHPSQTASASAASVPVVQPQPVACPPAGDHLQQVHIQQQTPQVQQQQLVLQPVQPLQQQENQHLQQQVLPAGGAVVPVAPTVVPPGGGVVPVGAGVLQVAPNVVPAGAVQVLVLHPGPQAAHLQQLHPSQQQQLQGQPPQLLLVQPQQLQQLQQQHQ